MGNLNAAKPNRRKHATHSPNVRERAPQSRASASARRKAGRPQARAVKARRSQARGKSQRPQARAVKPNRRKRAPQSPNVRKHAPQSPTAASARRKGQTLASARQKSTSASTRRKNPPRAKNSVPKYACTR